MTRSESELMIWDEAVGEKEWFCMCKPNFGCYVKTAWLENKILQIGNNVGLQMIIDWYRNGFNVCLPFTSIQVFINQIGWSSPQCGMLGHFLSILWLGSRDCGQIWQPPPWTSLECGIHARVKVRDIHFTHHIHWICLGDIHLFLKIIRDVNEKTFCICWRG